ncbi:MAG: hypothetical protein PHX30_03875 [Candidatus Pacebacteria bacterium]|nr:hypothetical protein [Candidatus Paceibacterota bacterium]
MNNPLYKLNQALEELGQNIAQIAVSLFAMILILLPGAVFVFLIYGVFTGEKFSISECANLIFYGIVSWYIGLGLHKLYPAEEKSSE